jgi:hypothetical protein
MRRDMSCILTQFLIGRNRYVCEDIDDFLSNNRKIKYRGDCAVVLFEGHYFLSYDFVCDSEVLQWNGNLVPKYSYKCVNGVMEHFRGAKIEIDVNPVLHNVRNGDTDNIYKEGIFWPVFSFRREDSLMCLEDYEVAPRKFKDKNRILFSMVPAFEDSF